MYTIIMIMVNLNIFIKYQKFKIEVKKTVENILFANISKTGNF